MTTARVASPSPCPPDGRLLLCGYGYFLTEYLSGAAVAVAVLASFTFFLSTLAGRASAIPLPTINTNNIVNVTNAPYNAVGDGVTTNTTAIQNAINAAALGGKTNGLSGGTVEIPAAARAYLSGPLTMASYVNLQIDSGAKLQMLPYGSYPGGSDPTDFISASDLKDIEISGSGTIDGQGAAWWTAYNADNSLNRPRAMFAPAGCNPVLVRDVTLQNPPNTHLSFRSSDHVPCGNVTVTNITINTPDGTPNTDGMDVSATNVLVVNSSISDGDDHIAIGDSAAFDGNITVTNCLFGTGHGVSIGSYTSGGVSNLMVINCVWNGSENGIRLKSERGRGGLVQSLNYENLSMTNVQWPILIYSYYNYGEGTLLDATPYMAATDTVQTVNTTTPIWRNIIISNVTATITGGQPPIMIWGLPEMLVSNVTLSAVTITGGTKDCEIYITSGLQFVNSQVPLSAGNATFELYHAQLTITNSALSNNLVTLSGLTTNSYGNTLALYNARGSLQDPDALENGPLTLGNGAFTVSNNLTLSPAGIVNYVLGTNAATVVVKGNLALGGTNNISAGGGFTNGTYTLMTCTGALSGTLPALGATPPGFDCAFVTNSSRDLNLIVTSLLPGVPANLTALGTNLSINLQWSASSNAGSYDLQRSTINGGPYATIADVTATNYSDAAVIPGTTYFYVVATTNADGASANSIQAGAVPLPSLVPPNLAWQVNGNQLQLSWPADHLGWLLQMQTNDLGTNWVDCPGSTNIFQTNLILNPANGAVFLRLIYP
jgi:polygalacturonase